MPHVQRIIYGSDAASGRNRNERSALHATADYFWTNSYSSLTTHDFGKEEEGLIGSRAMVDEIKTNDEYCAMINVDSLGLAVPRVMDNTSNSKLEKTTEDLAKEMKIPFSHARIDKANADSSSFLARNIPAVTITGLTNDWPKILHSRKDQATTVIPDSVFLGYRLALALVTRVDTLSCDAYKY